MKKKALITIIVLVITIAVVTPLLYVLFLLENGTPPGDNGTPPIEISNDGKAIILCSANDFYPTEGDEDFNGGIDSNLNSGSGNWIFYGYDCIGGHSATGGIEDSGCLFVTPTSEIPISARFAINYTNYYDLVEYAYYNVSMSFKIQSIAPIIGLGIRMGIVWCDNHHQLVREYYSNYCNSTDGEWSTLSVSEVCNNGTENNLFQKMIIRIEIDGELVGGPIDQLYFDDIKVDRWIAVNVTDPIDPNPPPSSIDSDGFPAQALHVYWILKNHGYNDSNIFLMLYHKNDLIIDIKAGDGIANDLVGAIIDVEDDDVNASRFKQELNATKVGSFASQIDPEDKLIIFMTDHGSNGILTDGNATFHFEADNSYITEFEFYDLVKTINCERIMINIDSCFSGNFLNQNNKIGNSWYDLPNCLFVSSSSNVFSWYWINNMNGDGFAGSWFFHQFWEQLDQNQTINVAFNFAINFIPFGRGLPLMISQKPLLHDNLGINMTLSFNSDPPL